MSVSKAPRFEPVESLSGAGAGTETGTGGFMMLAATLQSLEVVTTYGRKTGFPLLDWWFASLRFTALHFTPGASHPDL